MKQINRTRLGSGLLALALVGIGVFSAGRVTAATDLSTADLGAISTEVSAAINAAKGTVAPGASQAAIDAAVASAIEGETKSLIGKYASADPTAVAEALATAASDAGASANALGTGMADAAISEGGSTGKAVATAIGSVASTDAVTKFKQVVRNFDAANGTGYADAADSAEIAAGAGGGGGGGGGGGVAVGGGGGGAGAGGGGGGCTNPSCT